MGGVLWALRERLANTCQSTRGAGSHGAPAAPQRAGEPEPAPRGLPSTGSHVSSSPTFLGSMLNFFLPMATCLFLCMFFLKNNQHGHLSTPGLRGFKGPPGSHTHGDAAVSLRGSGRVCGDVCAGRRGHARLGPRKVTGHRPGPCSLIPSLPAVLLPM